MSDESNESLDSTDEDLKPPKRRFNPTMGPMRASVLYDTKTSSLNIKKLAAYVGGIAAFVAAMGALGTKSESFVKWWLELDELETSVVDCHDRIDSVDAELDPEDPPPDPNVRLDVAIPLITSTLREHRVDLRGLRDATTKLSTIHEYGLDRTRARVVAREAQAAAEPRSPVRPVRPPGFHGGASAARRIPVADAEDPLAGLDGL